MSTSDAVIDPALRDLPAPQHAGGMKRKARSSASGTTPSQKQPTTPARVTRRQAAAAAAGSAPSTSAAASKSRRGRGAATSGAEPSRGEEENLITYDWARNSNTKRQRQESPSHAQPDASKSSYASPTLEGIENLAAAAAFQSDPPRPIFPYPFGLTPFRYPCLTPHHPQPPPGDPNDPNFKPMDPSHDSGIVEESSTHSSRPMSRLPSAGMEYASLSSLLAASEAQFSGSPAAGHGR